MISLDNFVENFFYALRGSAGVKFFSVVTLLGEWKILIFAVVIIAALFWLNNKKSYTLPFLAAVLGAEITGQLLKIIIHRPRPLGGIETENTFSFPSGHALISAAFYGFLIYYFWQRSKNKTHKFFFLILGIILILLIGISRLYLDVHYLSDVVAGYVIGLVWLWVSVYINKNKLCAS